MNLKEQLASKTPLVGTFIKSTHYHNTEVLSYSDLGLLCLDAEHAPFDRSDLDTCVLAARANNMPVVIRVPNNDPSTLLNALDIGADGVVLPHIYNAKQLEDVVQKCFFGNEGRGYAGSTRNAAYTTSPIANNLTHNKKSTCVIAQIEDLKALDEIDEICQVDNVDCIFVGRMDLTVSLGTTNPKDDSVLEAVHTIVNSAHKYGKTTGMFVGDLSELPMWIEAGVSLFLLNSDHGFLLAGAKSLKSTFDNAVNANQ
ncbi:MAG: HpcH/HpaI aldolase family protein [Colwellia sp.]